MRVSTLIGLSLLLLAGLALAAEPTARQIEQAYRLTLKAQRTLGTGNVEKARTQLEKALALAPDLPECHVGLGHLAMQERRFEDALASYEEALEGYENMGDGLLDLRVRQYDDAQQKILQNDDRISYLRDVMNNANTLPQTAQRIRGQIESLENENRQLRAIEYPRLETSHEPPGKVWFFIGNAQANLGRVDEALAAWELCNRKSPRFAPVHNNLAVAYLAQGRLEEAREHVARAEELGLHVNPRLREDLGLPPKE
jgi:tetratricopeptide (TPR) repeat protein